MNPPPEDALLSAYVLGEIEDPQTLREIEAALAADPDLRRLCAELEATAQVLATACRAEPLPVEEAERLTRSLRQEEARATPRSLSYWGHLWVGTVGLAASLAVLLGLASVWWDREAFRERALFVRVQAPAAPTPSWGYASVPEQRLEESRSAQTRELMERIRLQQERGLRVAALEAVPMTPPALPAQTEAVEASPSAWPSAARVSVAAAPDPVAFVAQESAAGAVFAQGLASGALLELPEQAFQGVRVPALRLGEASLGVVLGLPAAEGPRRYALAQVAALVRDKVGGAAFALALHERDGTLLGVETGVLDEAYRRRLLQWLDAVAAAPVGSLAGREGAWEASLDWMHGREVARILLVQPEEAPAERLSAGSPSRPQAARLVRVAPVDVVFIQEGAGRSRDDAQRELRRLARTSGGVFRAVEPTALP